MTEKIKEKLFTPINAESLAVFRIFFGLIMLWEVTRYFNHGWIERYWVYPVFHFKYEWFHWVEPLSATGLSFLFYLLGLLSVFIIAGFLYRISASLLFLIFTYTFLLEQARYLNHFYLIMLISFLMVFLPAHKTWSIDALLMPQIREKWIPRWTTLLLQFQIGIVYFFGGIAKLNRDWLTGSPMDLWLPRRSEFPIIGNYFSIPEVTWFISYSGLLLDLLAFPLLMIRKTRPWIASALVLFHLLNDRFFSIGIFPWFMIAALTIYLPSLWPEQIYSYLREKSQNQLLLKVAVGVSGALITSWFHERISPIPFLIGFLITVILMWDFQKNPTEDSINQKTLRLPKKAGFVLTGLAIFCIMQIAIPLRHFAIPGNPSWTEEGHRFAWHMKLRSKSCDAIFFTDNPATMQREQIESALYLPNWQRNKMVKRPQLIVQFAGFLSGMNNEQSIYADIYCSLNGAPPRQLIDPNTDLTKVAFYDWKQNAWIYR
ncbi:MAG: HTTM domain-containing protein [Balneolaceae bacterium]